MKWFFAMLLLALAADAQPFAGGLPTFVQSGVTAFYVDNTTGLDANDGRSPATAWQHVHYAATNGIAVGNCQVLLNGAEVFSETLPIVWTNSGLSASQPILVSSYGVGTATLTNAPGNQTCFGIIKDAANFLVFSALNFAGNPANTPGSWVTNALTVLAGTSSTIYCGGIVVGASSALNYNGLTVSNCAFSNLGSAVALYSTNDGFGVTNINIVNNTFSSLAYFAVWTMGQGSSGYSFDFSGLTICGNSISNVLGVATEYSGTPLQLNQVSNALITGNTIHDCGQSAANNSEGGPGGIVWQYGFGFVVSSNSVYHIHWNGSQDGIGIDPDINSANSIVEYNVCHDNSGSGIISYHASTNITIRYNVCYANGQAGSTEGYEYSECGFSGSTLNKLAVYGNTFLATYGTADALIGPASVGGSTTNWIANNILFSSASNSLNWPAANTAFLGNDYFTSAATGPQFKIETVLYHSLAAFTGAGFDATGFAKSADPDFLFGWSYTWSNCFAENGSPNTMTNWMLATGSPVIGQAVDMNYNYGLANGGQDFRGNAIGNTNYAMGACTQTGTPGLTNIFAGLVAWWQFGEGGAATEGSDWSGNRNTSSLVGSPTAATNYITFSQPSSQHATVAANAALNTVPFTMTAWVRQTNVATKYQAIIGGATGAPEWLTSPTNYEGIFKEGGNVLGSWATSQVNQGNATWTHVAVTYDGVNLNFYTNAVNAGTSTSTSTTFTGTAALSIAYDRQFTQNYFNGDLRLVDIYNRILSPGELTDIYQLGLLANMNGVVGQ